MAIRGLILEVRTLIEAIDVRCMRLTPGMTTDTSGAAPGTDLTSTDLTGTDLTGTDLTAPLDTDQDVLRRVDFLLDRDARRRRSLWLLFLSDEHVQQPVVVPIDDVPERPDAEIVANLCDIIATVLEDAVPGGSAVVALTRPGDSAVNDADACWFRTLYGAARERGASIRMLCLATRAGVRQLTLDDAI
jgi:Pentapeptide repeats (8 copies)